MSGDIYKWMKKKGRQINEKIGNWINIFIDR